MNLAGKTSGSYCLLDHPFYLSQNHWNSRGSSPFPLKAVQQLTRYSLCAPLQAPARSRVCSATVFQKSHNKRSLVPIFKDTATFQVYMFIPPPGGSSQKVEEMVPAGACPYTVVLCLLHSGGHLPSHWPLGLTALCVGARALGEGRC